MHACACTRWSSLSQPLGLLSHTPLQRPKGEAREVTCERAT